MSANQAKVIGVDLGGTRIKTGLVDARGKILFLKNYSTRLELGREKVVKRMVKVTKQLIEISIKNRIKPNLIGLGVPGVIDRGGRDYSPFSKFS